MSAQGNLVRLSVGQFAERFRNEMIPLSNTFSYFCASVPLSDEDLKEYLQEPIASLPIAAVTAHATEEDRRQCLGAGMNDFITKPVRREALNALLGRWINSAVCEHDIAS